MSRIAFLRLICIRKKKSTTRFTRCSLRYSETMIRALSSDRGFAVSLKTPESYTGELMTRGRLPQRKTPHMVPQPNMPEWRRQPRWKVDAVDFRQPSTETGVSILACSAAVPYTASRPVAPDVGLLHAITSASVALGLTSEPMTNLGPYGKTRTILTRHRRRSHV